MQDEKHTEHMIYVSSERDLQEIQLLIKESTSFLLEGTGGKHLSNHSFYLYNTWHTCKCVYFCWSETIPVFYCPSMSNGFICTYKMLICI